MPPTADGIVVAAKLSERDASRILSGVVGRPSRARFLQRRHRNEMWCLPGEAVLKLYTAGEAAQKAMRKVAALAVLEQCGVAGVPKLLDHGVLDDGTPWTVETAVPLDGSRAEGTADVEARHRALGSWIASVHAATSFGWHGGWEPMAGETSLARSIEARVGAAIEAARTSPTADQGLVSSLADRARSLCAVVADAEARAPRGALDAVLVHGAWCLDNAVLHREGEEATWHVVGAYDWEDAQPGDAAGDAALPALWELRNPSLDGFLDGYESVRPLGPALEERLTLWVIAWVADGLEWAPRLHDALWGARCPAAARALASGAMVGRRSTAERT